MLTMCRSALTITFGVCQRGPQFGPLSLNPKHSTAVLVGCQIPLWAGPNLLVWRVDEGWREASGCSIWLLSDHSCVGDVTESAGTRQQNTKSMKREHLGNPKSMYQIWPLQPDYTRVRILSRLAATWQNIEFFQNLTVASTFLKSKMPKKREFFSSLYSGWYQCLLLWWIVAVVTLELVQHTPS